MRQQRLAFGVALATFAVILFAASLPATRLAVRALDPWHVTAARAAGAGVAAAVVLAALRRRIPWPDLPRLASISLCLVIGFPGLMAVAMITVPAAHGGVILGLLPMATAIAATLVAGERPSPAFFTLSAIGAALVVVFSLPEGGYAPAPGDLYLLAGVAICGTGYALAGSLSRRMPGWEVISWAVVAALPVSLPATFVLWPESVDAVRWPAWASLLYLALVSQYFGFFLWNSALATGGVARIGQVQLLQPFATLGIAAVLLGETIGLRTLLFAAAVMAIVALGTRTRVAPRHAGSPARPSGAPRGLDSRTSPD
jgi:drug/metabolite transporter (DMT)-like permease